MADVTVLAAALAFLAVYWLHVRTGPWDAGEWAGVLVGVLCGGLVGLVVV